MLAAVQADHGQLLSSCLSIQSLQLIGDNCYVAPSGSTVASGVVSVVVFVVVVGVCNRSRMRTSKCTCLIFGVSIGLDPVSYTHLTLPTNREV